MFVVIVKVYIFAVYNFARPMNKHISIVAFLISVLIYCFGICSADAANIHVFSKDGVDKALLSAARSAADCWASYLQNEQTIYVQLDYGDIAASTPIFTDVVYVEYGNLIRPSALASQLRNSNSVLKRRRTLW